MSDDKDAQIKKLQAEILQLEIKNFELGREIIHLNGELLNSAATQFNRTCIDGGHDE